MNSVRTNIIFFVLGMVLLSTTLAVEDTATALNSGQVSMDQYLSEGHSNTEVESVFPQLDKTKQSELLSKQHHVAVKLDGDVTYKDGKISTNKVKDFELAREGFTGTITVQADGSIVIQNSGDLALGDAKVAGNGYNVHLDEKGWSARGSNILVEEGSTSTKLIDGEIRHQSGGYFITAGSSAEIGDTLRVYGNDKGVMVYRDSGKHYDENYVQTSDTNMRIKGGGYSVELIKDITSKIEVEGTGVKIMSGSLRMAFDDQIRVMPPYEGGKRASFVNTRSGHTLDITDTGTAVSNSATRVPIQDYLAAQKKWTADDSGELITNNLNDPLILIQSEETEDDRRMVYTLETVLHGTLTEKLVDGARALGDYNVLKNGELHRVKSQYQDKGTTVYVTDEGKKITNPEKVYEPLPKQAAQEYEQLINDYSRFSYVAQPSATGTPQATVFNDRDLRAYWGLFGPVEEKAAQQKWQQVAPKYGKTPFEDGLLSDTYYMESLPKVGTIVLSIPKQGDQGWVGIYARKDQAYNSPVQAQVASIQLPKTALEQIEARVTTWVQTKNPKKKLP